METYQVTEGTLLNEKKDQHTGLPGGASYHALYMYSEPCGHQLIILCLLSIPNLIQNVND